jgi:hypothetical protein
VRPADDPQAQATEQEAQDMGRRWLRDLQRGRAQARLRLGQAVRPLLPSSAPADARGRLGSTKWKGTPLGPGYFDRIGPREVELEARVAPSQVPRVVGAADDAAPDDGEWDVPVPVPATPTPVSPGLKHSSGSAKKFVMPAAVSFYGKPAEKAKSKGPL